MKRAMLVIVAAAIMLLAVASLPKAEAQAAQPAPLYAGWNLISGDGQSTAKTFMQDNSCVSVVWHWVSTEQRWEARFRDVPSWYPEALQFNQVLSADAGYWAYCRGVDS